MDHEIFVNDLIKWESTNNDFAGVVERVLWIDEGYTIAFMLNIESTKGFPRTFSVSGLREALKRGEAKKIKKKILGSRLLWKKICQIRKKTFGIMLGIL